MPKLSTAKLKEMISGWAHQVPKRDLEHYLDMEDGLVDDDETYQESLNDFGIKGASTPVEALDRLYQLWCDGSMWKRVRKESLKDEWIEWFSRPNYDDPTYVTARELFREGKVACPAPPRVPAGGLECWGDAPVGWSKELFPKYDNVEQLARRCIVREFSHTNDRFADNWSLLVITTPEDDAVVCWKFNVD